MDDLNIQVKGFGSINEADIKLNKINVVGGVNSSGKSTISRLLYCFLKANFLSDERHIREVIVDKINKLIESQDDKFTMDDDFTDILNAYDEFVESNDEESAISSLVGLLAHDDKDYRCSEVLYDLILTEDVGNYYGSSRLYNSNYESFMGNEDVDAEFDEAGFVENFNKDKYDLNSDLYVIKTKGDLNNLEDIFYIDTFSPLDMLSFFSLGRYQDSDLRDIINPKHHLHYLINSLDNSIAYSKDDYDDRTLNMYTKINDIINGHMTSGLSSDFQFIDYDTTHFDNIADENVAIACGTGSTSSGIKQIGIVQLLLLNKKLKPGTILIFDEPEVNLHPKWQFKFAEILVNLVKELDVILYINSHSPMFIESVDAFAEYYDMQEDISYYLTEESKINGKYNFKKISSDELYKIYDNLGNAYDLIDQLRLKKHLGE